MRRTNPKAWLAPRRGTPRPPVEETIRWQVSRLAEQDSPPIPAFPTLWVSGDWGSLRSRSRGRLLFELDPLRLRALSHSLFACRRTGTNAVHHLPKLSTCQAEGVPRMVSEQDVGEDARHAAKMAKKKAARDRMMAEKSGEKGLIIVHTGAGKGKSSSAFGMILRCV